MRALVRPLALAALLALSACGKPTAPVAQPPATADAAAKDIPFGCAGPFGPDASKASLTEYFGAANVVDMTVDGPEGTTNSATVIFPNDTAKRVEVLWVDEAARQRPANIEIKGASAWQTVQGLKIGSSIEDVEKANGHAFKLTGFGWDYGGNVVDWMGGSFAPKDGVDAACITMINLQPGDGAPTERVTGEQEHVSDEPAIRAAKPVVYSLSVGYRSGGK
jgi:hypothetical protein